MRTLTFGAEARSFTDVGWALDSGIANFVTMGSQRQAAGGLGGLYAVQMGQFAAPGVGGSPDLAIPQVEGYYRVAIKTDVMSAAGAIRLRNAGVTIADVQVNVSNQIEIRVNGALQDTSTTTLTDGTWYVLNIFYRMLAAGGLFQVFLDDDLTTPIATFSGNTDPTAAVDIEDIAIVGENDVFDDICIHAPTQSYDGGSGSVPTLGETITGGSSGATAIVYAFTGNATAGRLWYRTLTGTFTDNEAITGGTSTFAAVVDAPPAKTNTPGLDMNSGFPSVHGYITALHPNAVGAFEDMTANPVAAMGNYENVDDWQVGTSNDSDFVESGTPGTRDFYGVSNPANGWTGVNHVEVVGRAKRQGVVINNIELAVRPLTTEFYGSVQPLNTAFGDFRAPFDVNPDDDQLWQVSDLTSLQIGLRVSA